MKEYNVIISDCCSILQQHTVQCFEDCSERIVEKLAEPEISPIRLLDIQVVEQL